MLNSTPSTPFSAAKAAFQPLLDALYHGREAEVCARLRELLAPDCQIKFCHPFEDLRGADELISRVYGPLFHAMPNLERRDFIVMAGPRWGVGTDETWIGIGGNIVGSFEHDWLGIPATGRPVFMRYHEYYRLEDGKVTEMSALWDIPQLAKQAGSWDYAIQPGVEWMCPGPARRSPAQDGLAPDEYGNQSVQLVWDMLHQLQKGDVAEPLKHSRDYWHPNCLWYGPTGIGTGRTPAGFQNVILDGFRSGLSDNVRKLKEGVFFGDGDLVAFTGWPSGIATHSGPGFLGHAATGKRIERRSLDFWRCEDGQIRENWVLVDLPHIYSQLGIEIFKEYN